MESQFTESQTKPVEIYGPFLFEGISMNTQPIGLREVVLVSCRKIADVVEAGYDYEIIKGTIGTILVKCISANLSNDEVQCVYVAMMMIVTGMLQEGYSRKRIMSDIMQEFDKATKRIAIEQPICIN